MHRLASLAEILMRDDERSRPRIYLGRQALGEDEYTLSLVFEAAIQVDGQWQPELCGCLCTTFGYANIYVPLLTAYICPRDQTFRRGGPLADKRLTKVGTFQEMSLEGLRAAGFQRVEMLPWGEGAYQPIIRPVVVKPPFVEGILGTNSSGTAFFDANWE